MWDGIRKSLEIVSTHKEGAGYNQCGWSGRLLSGSREVNVAELIGVKSGNPVSDMLGCERARERPASLGKFICCACTSPIRMTIISTWADQLKPERRNE